MKQGLPSTGLSWIRSVEKRLARHLENNTTDLPTTSIHSQKAADIYFQSSRDRVAQAAPTFIVPSVLLPPGHLVADYIPSSNTPVLLYRDPSDPHHVKAYRNQCRHRGAALIPPMDASQFQTKLLSGAGLTCPYHAWTYDARNGKLKAVPGKKVGFPCLEKDALGLQPIKCHEIAGGIWVDGESDTKSSNSRNDLWSLNEIHQELQALWTRTDSDPKNIHQSSDSSSLVGYREWTLQYSEFCE